MCVQASTSAGASNGRPASAIPVSRARPAAGRARERAAAAPDCEAGERATAIEPDAASDRDVPQSVEEMTDRVHGAEQRR